MPMFGVCDSNFFGVAMKSHPVLKFYIFEFFLVDLNSGEILPFFLIGFT